MKKGDKLKFEDIVKIMLSVILAFLMVGFVGYIVYVIITTPRPEPVHLDFSLRNIGNHVGRESGEFGKGFFRGLLGKDKGER